VAPGLYELTMGFFNCSKPAIQLLVNGKTILSAVQASQSNVIHHGVSAKQQTTGKTGMV